MPSRNTAGTGWMVSTDKMAGGDQVSMQDTVARLDGVTKRYGDTYALRDISLDIGRGGVLALLGPNGAGKTTSVKLMLGHQDGLSF